MKYRNKKKELMQALFSKDKEKLRKALSMNKPEKWMTIVRDYNRKSIEYQNRFVSEEEMKAIIEEAAKEFQVKLIVMYQNRSEEGLEETWSIYEPDIVVNYGFPT